jgi:HTH-type transcriptional regulator / antitoxin HipB
MENSMISSIARGSKQFGQAVRNRRRALKLTQSALAKKVGSYQKTISKLEAGDSGVKLQTIFDVLAALDLELVIQPRSESSTRIEDLF